MRRLFPVQLAIALGLVGCQGPSVLGPDAASLGIDQTPVTLTQPQTFDWTFHRVAGRQIASGREDYVKRQVLAYPNATNWASGASLTAMGCNAGDTMPNGPAAVFSTKTTPVSLKNKVFIITAQGKFIRVDRANPAAFTTLALNKTFTSTYVTLSPSAKRAYVVSDDGTLFVINTAGMTVISTASLGATALGCTPTFDPYHADNGGAGEDLYVPDNSGYVSKYTFTNGALSGQTKYPVATTVTPIDGGTEKIQAPAVVLDRVIYVGDQGGGMHVYNTQNTAANAVFFTGSPINTSPAIEVQDGTYSLTDSSGLPKTVARGTPIYAFVTSGANCFWFDLISLKTYRSRSLYLDDNSTKTYGYLAGYTYDTSTTTTPISLTDWCAIRTDSETNLSGGVPNDTSNKTNAYIAAGEIGAYGSDASTGPVVCYMRFSTGTTTPTIVKQADLSLTVENGYRTKLPDFRPASSFLKGTTTLWTFANLTNATRPDWDTDDIAIYTAGAVDGWGNIKLNPGSACTWDISGAFAGTVSSDYTVVMLYDQNNNVIWEAGGMSADNGNKPTKVYGPQFRSPASTKPPVFNVRTTVGSFPSPTIETPAVIDAFRKRVYVFYSNTLYSIDYSSPAAWEDEDSANPTTLFNSTYLGRSANGGGASYANKTRFVSNLTAPVFNYNLTYAYTLDRYPATTGTSPTSWNYRLSKTQLPLVSTADRLVTTTPPSFAGVSGTASNYMIIDPFTNLNTTGGNVFFGLGNGKVYQYDQ